MDEQNYVNEIAFSQPVINIGADPGNDIVLRGKGVLPFHAMLNYSADMWHLLPLDESVSMRVNGRGVSVDGTPVQSGAVLSLGDYNLTLSLNGVNADILISQAASAVTAAPNVSGQTDSAGGSILLSVTDYVPAELEAGSSLEFGVSVTNAGPLVANMQLQLQGIPSAWVQIIPPVLNLNEGRTGTFTIRINPPRSSAAEAGYYQLHFVAISPNYPRETGTADTSLTILPYSEFLVNGPTPRRLTLSRRKPSDSAELVIINNSNAASNFVVRAYDDANELNFTYRSGVNSLMQGQDTVMIRPGDNERIPLQVEAKKRPLFGLMSRTHNYYTTVAPADRPGDAQSLVGEVQVRPLIHVFWLFLVLILGLVAAFLIFQPYIYSFEGISGKHTEVIQAGNSAWVSWRVSRFASKITLDDGKTIREIPNQGEEYITPSASTTLKIRAENFISNLFGISLYEKQISILLIPKLPTIDRLDTDRTNLYYNQPVTINWAVSSNADTADLVADKQRKSLPAEQFSGSQQSNFIADTLISLRAVNASGFEVKSVFLNVKPDKITLDHFIAWVRPNGIAVPADNDVRRTTRWGSLQALYGLNNTSPARVNPMPDAQSNTIVIPDTYNSGSGSSAGMNPEQQMVAQLLSTPVSETEIRGGNMDPSQLLVGPSVTATPAVPTVAAPDRSGQTLTVPSGSPQSASASREFSVKLAEIVEDSSADSGYRVIQYFPDYVLQAGEEVLLEWSVDGVSKVKIDNLSGDELNASDSTFIYPEKSTNYVLNAEIGNVKKAYSLPVNVAGAADDGQGSGLKCDLKANATTLAVPGTVMLTWTGGGNNRVQLISSAKAEAEKAEADKKAEEEAKARGEEYTPDPNAPLTGGIIADYLQPAGFMRVNIDQQTTFVLNCFDGNGNVICTKDVEIKYTGGVDKLDLKFAITRVTNTKDETVEAFYVGQTAQFTVALTDYEKGKDPTGNIMITDGDSSCTMTLPKTTCSMVMKHAGTRTVTAVYSGDDTYNKKTATTRVRVRDKRDLTLEIIKITDEKEKSQDTYVVGQNVLYTVRLRRFNTSILPTGTVKLSDGTSTCTVNVGAPDEQGRIIGTCSMAPKAAGTLKITADYSGDEVYNAAQAESAIEVAAKRDITFEIVSITNENNEEQDYYTLGQNVRVTVALSDYEAGLDPTGTFLISDGDSSCTASYPVVSCMIVPKRTGERTVTAIYSGDGNYASRKDTGTFEVREKIPTVITIADAYKTNETHASFLSALTWDQALAEGKQPSGTITYTLSNASADLGKCVYDIAGSKLSCEGSHEAKDTADPYNFNIADMLIPNLTDRIKAEYSGDVYFASSTSSQILFKKIPTSLTIDKAMKNAEKNADLTVTLKAEEDAPSDQKPVGKITFKSDANANNTTTVCVFVLDTLKFENCSGKIDESDVVYEFDSEDGRFLSATYPITEMTVNTVLGDSVIAEYSGDVLYGPSVSKTAEFDMITKADTELELSDAYKSAEKLLNYTAVLKWDLPDTDEEEKPVPTGTVTFKIGTDSCKFTFDGSQMNLGEGGAPKDIDKSSFSCSGENTMIRLVERKDPEGDEAGLFKWEFESVLLSSGTADRIQADYSGDTYFNSSSSIIVMFTKIPTNITIDEAEKTTDKNAAITVTLEAAGETLSSRKPGGKITFKSDANLNNATTVCVLVLDTLKFENCSGMIDEASIVYTYDADNNFVSARYPIKNMTVNTVLGDTVIAEYSGDGLYESSASEAKKFETVTNTYLEITDAYKSAEDLANYTVTLKWDSMETAEGEKPVPTGTVTFKIGSESCKLTFDGSEMTIADGEDSKELDPHSFSCSGEKTKIRLTERKDPEGDESGLFTWKFEQVLLSSGTADRIQGEYSGDSNFSSSSSLIVLFTKIPTELKVTDMKKTDETHLEIHTELTWDENMSAYGFTPTGTVKFTVGSGVCTLDLTSMDLDCESAAVTVKPSPDPATEPLETPKKLLIDITGMKLTDKTADIVKLEYSGDVLFMKSVSNAAFNKIPPGLKLTIMDEAGETHDAYPVNGKIRAEIEMTNALPELYPTGTVDITIDTEKCTITLPQTACFMTLPATPGDRNAAAKYAGDAVYTADSSTEKVIINTKKMVTLNLSHSDTDGTEQEAYYINQKIRITAAIEGDDASQPATGEITISAGANACSINYPTETSCVITASQIGTMTVTGSYAGDLYYNSAKTSIDLEVVRHELRLDITDVTSTRFDNETQDYMRQPYYVYDDKARNGQEVRVVAALSGLVSGKDPTGTVTIMNQDNITLCSYTLPQDKCTFNVSKFGDEGRFGEIRLKARYEGDSFYAPADAEGTVNVQKRIPVKLTINNYPLAMLPDQTSEQFELVFAYDRTLPDTYGVGPEVDKTKSTKESEWGHGTVTFTLSSSSAGSEKECTLDLYTGKLDDACVKPETEKKEDGKTLYILPETTVEREDTDEGFVYRIYAMYGGKSAADKIKVKYDAVPDNDLFYFYPSADADVKYIEITPEDKGKVELEINDFVEVENARSHAFLRAQLKYAPDIAEKYQTKPLDKLTIIAKNNNNSVSYVYDLKEGTINDNNVEVIRTDPEMGLIEFVIKNVWSTWDIEQVELKYSSDGSGESCDQFFKMQETINTTPVRRSVDIKIDNVVNADINTASTIFSIGEIPADLETYGIFDGKVTLTVKDGDNAVCKFNRETLQFESSCQGTVTAVDGRYVVKDATGFDDPDGLIDSLRVSLYSPYLGADSPGDEAEIEMIPILITVSDAVTMNSRDLYATLNVNIIDETDPATGTDLTWARIRELYDVVPKSADWHTAAKSCHFDLSSDKPKCDTASMAHGVFSGGTATYMLYNWQISPGDTSVYALLYDHHAESPDHYYGYFEAARSNDAAIRDDTPVIEVKNAMRSSQNNAYVTFTLTYPLGLLESKYQALTEIVFENVGGPTGYYDTTIGAFPDYVPVDGTLTKTGNRYVVRDLHGKNVNFSNHDHFGIWLSGPYSTYRDTTFTPAYYSKVEAKLSITDATRFDRAFAFMQTIFSIDDVDWLTEYGLKLEGTFNFTARGADETGGERVNTCSLVMPAGSFSCDPAQNDAEAKVEYTGGTTWKFTLRNMTADTYYSEPLFTVTGYNSYLFNVQNPIVSYTRFTEARPGLIVTDALKTSAETTSVTFTLNNYSDLWDTDYRVFGDLKLQLSVGEPPDAGDYHYILTDWETIRGLSDGVSHHVDLVLGYTADITKNGATIEIKNFTMEPENYRYFLVGVLYRYDRDAYEFSGYRPLTNNLGFGTFSPVSLSVDIEP